MKVAFPCGGGGSGGLGTMKMDFSTFAGIRQKSTFCETSTGVYAGESAQYVTFTGVGDAGESSVLLNFHRRLIRR